jgi:hypothetical protein
MPHFSKKPQTKSGSKSTLKNDKLPMFMFNNMHTMDETILYKSVRFYCFLDVATFCNVLISKDILSNFYFVKELF